MSDGDCWCAGLWYNGSAEDARSNAHVTLSLSSVWQSVLSSVAATRSPAYTHRRTAVPVPALRPCLRRPIQPTSAPADARRRQEIPLSCLQQAVFSHVTAGQASRSGVLLQQLTHTHPLSPLLHTNGRIFVIPLKHPLSCTCTFYGRSKAWKIMCQYFDCRCIIEFN